MATSPEHMDNLAQAPAHKAGKPPITASPAFPWIVALWFAALLGIGSLIVPVALLERASTATGIASVLPMAAPPLGFTAQALVALVGTLLGGALGLFLAKKIAAPKTAGPGTFGDRRPLNPAQDIGDPGIDAVAEDDLPPPAPAGRRRALAITEEDGPSDFLNVAPLPDAREHDREVLEVSLDMQQQEPEAAPEIETPVFETSAEDALADDTPDAAQFDEPRQEFQPFELDESAALTDEQPGIVHDDAEQSLDRQDFMAVAQATGPVVEVAYSEPVVAPATAREPLPFSPPSMAREDEEHGEAGFVAEQTFIPEEDAGPESEDTVSDKQIFQAPETPDAEVTEVETPTMAVEQADTPIIAPDEAEEDGEGLVQLVQRLGSTLEKHREWSAELAAQRAVPEAEETTPEDTVDDAPAVSEAPVPKEFDPAAAEDAAQAMASFFGKAEAAPAAQAVEVEVEVEEETPRQRYGSLQGTIAAVDVDAEEDEEDEVAEIAASFTLPLAKPVEAEPMPRPAFDQPPAAAETVAPVAAQDEAVVEAQQDEEESDEPASPADFASLNPFKRNAEEFVRIEEPEPEVADAEPAVLFPNQEARKPAAPAAPASRAFDPPAARGDAAPQRAERPRPSNDDNERALREALMNLQRMGK